MKRLSYWLLPLLLFCLLLTGCSSEEKDLSKAKVDEFLTLYQSLDGSAGNCLANQIGDTTVEFKGMQAVLAQKMTFETGKVKKEGEYYLVTVKIQNVDFAAAFEAVQQEVTSIVSTEEIVALLQQKLTAEDAVMREFKVEVPVQKNGAAYEIVMNGELSNALFGGYNEYLSKLTGEMLNEK